MSHISPKSFANSAIKPPASPLKIICRASLYCGSARSSMK
jgi:hypothetical protein